MTIRKIDEYVAALKDVLPCASREEIRLKMSRYLHRRITSGIVGGAIGYVRRNCAEIGWTIPRVQPTQPTEDESERFYLLPVERDGSFRLTDENRTDFDFGSLAGVKSVARMLANMSASFKARVLFERSPTMKDYLSDAEEQITFTASRLHRVLRAMNAHTQQRNGTTG
jgi:hypothetical protein